MADSVRAGGASTDVGDGDGAGPVLPDLLLHAACVLHPQDRAVFPQR